MAKSKHHEKKRMASTNDMQLQFDGYMSELKQLLPEFLNEQFYELYKSSYEMAVRQGTQNGDFENTIVQTFENVLRAIPSWSQTDVEAHIKTYWTDKHALTIDDLRPVVRQLLVLRVGLLMSVRDDARTHANFNFVMPSDTTIVHSLLKRAARGLRINPQLYMHMENGKSISERQREKNTFAAEEIIRQSIHGAIQDLVPIHDVVKRHFVEKPQDIPPEQIASSSSSEESFSSSSSSSSNSEEKIAKYIEDEGESYEVEEEENYEVEEEENYEVEEEEEEEEVVETKKETRRKKKKVIDQLLDNTTIGNDSDEEPSKPVRLAKADVPADKSAAKIAIMENDSKKVIAIKEDVVKKGYEKKISTLKAQLKDAKKKGLPRFAIKTLEEELKSHEEKLHAQEKKLKERRK
jgi:hypothetical protein